jgi:L-rhamnose mutarotase
VSERVCSQLAVRPDRLEEYRARHREVWPDMLDALRAAGWRNYSLFLRDDGLLIGYLECDDFAAAQRKMEEAEVNARWQAEMAPLFELPAGSRPDTGASAPWGDLPHRLTRHWTNAPGASVPKLGLWPSERAFTAARGAE